MLASVPDLMGLDGVLLLEAKKFVSRLFPVRMHLLCCLRGIELLRCAGQRELIFQFRDLYASDLYVFSQEKSRFALLGVWCGHLRRLQSQLSPCCRRLFILERKCVLLGVNIADRTVLA